MIEQYKKQLENIVSDYLVLARVYLDKSTVHPTKRWLALFVLWLIVIYRVIHVKGWYVSLYCLGIFEINMVIAFLSPSIDETTDGYILPRNASEDFRPFQRKLPEYHFWLGSLIVTVVCLFTTFFRIFDLPVFWPLLLLYFILITIIMLKKKISDMIKHRYIPFTVQKKRYGDVSG